MALDPSLFQFVDPSDEPDLPAGTTPPVGTVLNVVAGVGRISMAQVVKGVNPFLITYLIILTTFIFFPQLVTAPVAWMR